MRGKLLLVVAASLTSSLVLFMLVFSDEQLLHLASRSTLRQAPALERPTAGATHETAGGNSDTDGAGKAKKQHRNKKSALEMENPLGEKAPLGQGDFKQINVPKRRLQELSSKINIKQPFHFPQPQFSQPDGYLLRSQWVFDLRKILAKTRGKQINMVTASIEHQDVLLNWLISAYAVATPPLDNVLVLSLDEPLHNLLKIRGISSLWVSPSIIIDPTIEIARRFSQVHIVRLNVLRLIVNYGFDVVNYDCDAIVLKNPQTVFDKHKDADIIGTFGKGPGHLFSKWGVTLNTGVLLFRSNSKVGESVCHSTQ